MKIKMSHFWEFCFCKYKSNHKIQDSRIFGFAKYAWSSSLKSEQNMTMPEKKSHTQQDCQQNTRFVGCWSDPTFFCLLQQQK